MNVLKIYRYVRSVDRWSDELIRDSCSAYLVHTGHSRVTYCRIYSSACKTEIRVRPNRTHHIFRTLSFLLIFRDLHVPPNGHVDSQSVSVLALVLLAPRMSVFCWPPCLSSCNYSLNLRCCCFRNRMGLCWSVRHTDLHFVSLDVRR